MHASAWVEVEWSFHPLMCMGGNGAFIPSTHLQEWSRSIHSIHHSESIEEECSFHPPICMSESGVFVPSTILFCTSEIGVFITGVFIHPPMCMGGGGSVQNAPPPLMQMD